MLNRCAMLLMAGAALAAAPAAAQQAGKGGTGVGAGTELPRCPAPLGVASLVEEKVASPTDQIPPGLAALVRLAEAQNGGSSAKVDPLPLLKLLAAKSGCFRIVERGEAFAALEAERQIAGSAAAGKRLVASDFLITAKVIYSDAKTRESGGGLGGRFGAIGLKSKTLESQVLLSLVRVETGVQEAVATGSARKRDLGIIGGGLLLNLGVGALGGGYADTDIGRITTMAMVDAFRALLADAQPRLAAASPPAPAAPLATAQPQR